MPWKSAICCYHKVIVFFCFFFLSKTVNYFFSVKCLLAISEPLASYPNNWRLTWTVELSKVSQWTHLEKYDKRLDWCSNRRYSVLVWHWGCRAQPVFLYLVWSQLSYGSVSSGRELVLSYVTFKKSWNGCCDQMWRTTPFFSTD